MVRRQTWQPGRRGDSKFSNRPVTFKSNRIGTSDSNLNRISKLRRSLLQSVLNAAAGLVGGLRRSDHITDTMGRHGKIWGRKSCLGGYDERL